MSKQLTLGIIGFGTVGQGLYDIISSKDLGLRVKQFVIKDKDKKRTLPAHLFTTDHNAVLNDPEIDAVVELIDDAEAAFDLVATAMAKGKHVVSANKKMIASHIEELVALQRDTQSSLLYEGAVCGSIPIIRNLEEYYDNELLHSVSGIFNGSSNYILSKIFNDGLEYTTALKQAQDLGFAETDPTMDVGGFDPKFKLIIVAAHAYGLYIRPEEVLNIGIEQVASADIRFAREKGYKIKLVPNIRKISDEQIVLYVLPKLVRPDNILYNVEYENNGVLVKAAFADEQFFYGKGAGGHPTGSAVLSDIAALRYGYKYEYKKHQEASDIQWAGDCELRVYLRYSDESLVEKLGFREIAEHYHAGDTKYVVGRITLDNIALHRNQIQEDGAFIAELD